MIIAQLVQCLTGCGHKNRITEKDTYIPEERISEEVVGTNKITEDNITQGCYHKVFPFLLEYQLAEIPGIKEITVDENSQKNSEYALVAIIVPDRSISLLQIKKTLEEYCNSNLQPYERPYIIWK